MNPTLITLTVVALLVIIGASSGLTYTLLHRQLDALRGRVDELEQTVIFNAAQCDDDRRHIEAIEAWDDEPEPEPSPRTRFATPIALPAAPAPVLVDPEPAWTRATITFDRLSGKYSTLNDPNLWVPEPERAVVAVPLPLRADDTMSIPVIRDEELAGVSA